MYILLERKKDNKKIRLAAMKCYKKSQIQPWPKLDLIEIIGKYNQLSLKSQLQMSGQY